MYAVLHVARCHCASHACNVACCMLRRAGRRCEAMPSTRPQRRCQALGSATAALQRSWPAQHIPVTPPAVTGPGAAKCASACNGMLPSAQGRRAMPTTSAAAAGATRATDARNQPATRAGARVDYARTHSISSRKNSSHSFVHSRFNLLAPAVQSRFNLLAPTVQSRFNLLAPTVHSGSTCSHQPDRKSVV